MLKAVIFDLDGTILDTLPDLNACMNAALEAYGCPPITLEQTRRYVGNGGLMFATRALPEGKRKDAAYFYKNVYCPIHFSCENRLTKPFPLGRAGRGAGRGGVRGGRRNGCADGEKCRDALGKCTLGVSSEGRIAGGGRYAVRKGLRGASKYTFIHVEGRMEDLSAFAGNAEIYAAANVKPLQDSPLRGKVFYFLGSSVTLGETSFHESAADFIAKRNGCICYKNAVSGTTLADLDDGSYVRRLVSDAREISPDLFICQLSTNDAARASLGDLILAEPEALIGFAGPRVIKDTTQAQLPEGFQTSEFLLKKGLIDKIIDRKNLRTELSLCLEYFAKASIVPNNKKQKA